MDNLTTLLKSARLAFSDICMIRTFYATELYVCGSVCEREKS